MALTGVDGLAVASAITVAATLDRTIAEPPKRIHPVALLGRAIAPFDRSWPIPRLVGLVIAGVLPLVAAGLAAFTIHGTSRVAGSIGLASGGVLAVAVAAAGVVLFTTISLRRLITTVEDVVELSASDVERARTRLRALAGRDPAALSPAHIRSAAVESAGENLADGLIAPLAAFVGAAVLGSAGSVVGADGIAHLSGVETLALAAGAAMWVKAVNTLDSMLGYPNKPVGWAPATLDDLVMWVPSRLCAVLLALSAGDPGALVRAREPASIPSSPNSGWPMATLGAVLGVQLTKPGQYTLACGPALPTVADANRGVAVVNRAGWLALALGCASGGLGVVAAVTLGATTAGVGP